MKEEKGQDAANEDCNETVPDKGATEVETNTTKMPRHVL